MTDIRLGSLVAECHGEGTPVVMIHGLGGSSNSFQPLMAVLDGYQVIRPDLPGAARSALKPGLPGLKGLAQAVRDLLRTQNLGRAHFVGHSMGTLICQHLAVESPDLVDSLTLYGPILEPPPAARDAIRERAATARKDGMAGIAEAISQGSVAQAASPAMRAFVRESLLRQDPAGYAAHCDALAAAE
ncbi:MAG: alpha/beta fold hydrolase, partial [Rhodovibrionaceae bacterium]